MKSLKSSTFYQRCQTDKEYQSLKNNKERIRYIVKSYGLSQMRGQTYEKADRYRRRHGKSWQRTKQYLNEGQIYFKGKRYESAIHCFTQAILNSPFDRKEKYCLSQCYSSRSEVFYQMANYENALFDSSLSLHLFPSEKMFVQKVFCLRILKRFTKAIDLIQDIFQSACNGEIELSVYTIEKLSELQNILMNEFVRNNYRENEDQIRDQELSHNFWIHPSVELKFTPNKGRHYVTKEFIPKNTTIIVEKAYSVVLFGENLRNHCLNCKELIGHNIYPCIGCNEVVFCSPECSEEAMSRYHRYECGIVGLMMTSSTNLHVFRMFAEFGCLSAYYCERSVKAKGFDVHQYINNEKNQTIERKNQNNTEKLLEFKAYATLVDHNEEQGKYRNVWHTFSAIESVILLEYANALGFDILQDIESFIAMTDVFVINMRRILCNVFGGFKYSGKDRTHVSNGHCFMASLMNHSCDANTCWRFDNKNITFVTNRDINAGEEVNDTYGPNKSINLYDRQQRLKSCYFFTCGCSVCLSDANSVPALQCLQCDGPVIYRLYTKESSCLKCGNDYQNFEKVVKKVEKSRVLFKQMIQNSHRYEVTEDTFDIILRAFKTIFGLFYRKSNLLPPIIRDFLIICPNYDLLNNAIDYCEPLLKEIDPKCDKSIGDLILCSEIYGKHLYNGSQNIRAEDWDIGFAVYGYLIDKLKDINDRLMRKYWINSEELLQFYEPLLRRKKVEFRQMIDIFENN